MTEDKKDEALRQAKDVEEKKKSEITLNPNPRANENVPDDHKKRESKDYGVGSEITDGEGG